MEINVMVVISFIGETFDHKFIEKTFRENSLNIHERRTLDKRCVAFEVKL